MRLLCRALKQIKAELDKKGEFEENTVVFYNITVVMLQIHYLDAGRSCGLDTTLEEQEF